MKTLYTIAAMLIISMTSYAQNILTDNLNWNATKATDKLNSGEIVYNCTLRTNAGQSIDWIQNNGSDVYHYTITQTTGTWSSIASDGQVTFQITASGGLTGTYIFSRSAGTITVRLTTSTNGQTDLDLLFSISDVQPAQ
ncbi:MAG TPA: hypothetical protein VIM65_01315 [Cyclobacteriaceae bacterium]